MTKTSFALTALPPEASEDEVKKANDLAARMHIFPRLRVQAFPNCCAVACLTDFGSNIFDDQDEIKGYYTNDKIRHLAAIVRIKNVLDNWAALREQRAYGPCLLITLNAHQMNAGIGKVLEKFFGAKKIGPSFKNMKSLDQPGPRIYIYQILA